MNARSPTAVSTLTLGYSQTNPSPLEHDRDASNPGIKNGVPASTSIRPAKPPTADAHDGLVERCIFDP